MESKPEPNPESSPASRLAVTPLPANLGVKVGMLIAFTITLAAAFVLYVLFARGAFEATQRLTLIADNAEGVGLGMDLTFSGFPIGRVQRIALGEDGKARIEIDVPQRDAHWLRVNSVFTLELPLVGAAKIRAFTANLKDELLPDGAERRVLRGDTAEEIPRMVATLRAVLENVDKMTETGSSLEESLKNARAVTERMAGKHGVLGGVLGGDDQARKVIAAIDRANALLASLGGVSLKMDSVLAKAEQRVFGQAGFVDETQKAVAQTNAILGEVRESLKKVDVILADAQATAGNAKAASTDLGVLRAEVDVSLRKLAGLIDEINRKWPFERDTKIKLP
jgi:phospholipid/cholesterol/gamma-HCH transport system substrate-binding protein